MSNANVANFLDAMHFRHACKEFDPTLQIPEDAFEAILEAGRLSPSSFGFEPWKFLVVQNMALREKIRGICWGGQGQLPTASHVVVILACTPEYMRPDSPYVQQTIMTETQDLPDDLRELRTGRYRSFLNEDFCLTGNERAGFEWAARQCYIALGNMLTIAAIMRIDSCPIEGFSKQGLEALLAGEGLLHDSEYGVACMAAFGYRRKKAPREKTRRPAEFVAQWVK